MQTASPKKVLTNGCFDPFHVGHLYHFTAARKFADLLVVAVTRNGFVNKGKNRPIFDEEERAAVIRALAIVDDVILVESSLEALCEVQPAIWAIGKEYEHRIRWEDEEHCRRSGIQIRFTNEKTYSSTVLCDRLRRG